MAKRQAGTQTTLRDRVTISGVGVHSGATVTMTLLPAEADTGILFYRTDIDAAADIAIPARIDAIGPTELCTTLNIDRLSVATVEHLLAAFSGLSVDNVIVEIDGPEVPVMDGSAVAFVDAIESVGLVPLAAPRAYIEVLHPVRVEQGSSYAELRPFDGRRFEIEIDFDHRLVGRQMVVVDLTPESFRNELARARTFGFLADVERLLAAGFARGASLDNAVVVAEDRILNPEGLRASDEFVRHKALDAVGDLALAGAPILGAYRSYRGGHRLNARMVEALLSDPSAYRIVERPSLRPEPMRAESAVALAGAALGPDRS